MLKIAVCDDEGVFRETLRKYIDDYMIKYDLHYQIDEFDSGEAFVGLESEMMQYTIAFLDINMKGMNGIDVAKKIRENDTKIFIVFVTAYMDYSIEGYKVDATRYLLKDIHNMNKAVKECMDAIINKMNIKSAKQTFQFREGKKAVLIESIIYIESRLHRMEFHIMNQNVQIYTMYGTLNEVEKELTIGNFVRIHQSFLVNLIYIEKIKYGKIFLKNGEELIIPKARYSYVRDSFIAYKGEL